MPNVADEKVTKWSIERGAFVGLDFARRRDVVDDRGHPGSENVFMSLYLCPHLFTNDVANPDS